ncbi:MAG: SDR family oxidoreductase [Acetobacteraceae bacterium]|nr:SDR family oxidoreductase [Acetobacteraceae bacterium]
MPLPPPPSFRLDGRRALVTGASRGIGRHAAIALAQAGAEVVLAARALPESEETAAALRDEGFGATAIALDVTDRAAVREAVAAAGPFDILVNNAGGNIRESTLDVTDEAFDRLLDLNIRACFTVAQAVAQGLVAAGRPGVIVNLSSINGHRAAAGRAVYITTKHAVEGMTKAMAADLAPQGIRVNAVCPGFVETPLTAGVLADPGFRQRVVQRMLIQRVMTTDDIVGAIVFLCSPAASMITGASLLVDGGVCAI